MAARQRQTQPESSEPATGAGAGRASESIEALTKRFAKLSRDKTVAETNLENARRQLDEIKRKAAEAYGTDDLEELKAKLKQRKEDNERKRAEYQKKLDEIEGDLKAVEDKYREAGSRESGAR